MRTNEEQKTKGNKKNETVKLNKQHKHKQRRTKGKRKAQTNNKKTNNT